MGTWRQRTWLDAGGATLAAAGAAGYTVWRPKPAPIGFAVSPDELARARALLARHPAVDAHTHPGRTFVQGAAGLAGLVWVYARLGTFEQATVRDMLAGVLAASAFAAVSDFQVLGVQGEGLVAVRDFAPGEAWASYQRQIGHLRALAAQGLVYPVLQVSDVEAARRAGKVGALLSVEGGDFLEGRPERVAQAWADGVRSITLMHYRNNDLGDIITGGGTLGRLSDAGLRVVRAMNAVGMLIDVAHAAPATALGAINGSTQPVMASHVHIHTREAMHPRFISQFLAKSIAGKGGGVLGAWPAGIGITDLRGFVDRTFDLIDAVGLDHVCLGTDMDANYKPVLDTYAKLPHYVAGLQQRGLREDEVARRIGGNFLRVLAAAQAR